MRTGGNLICGCQVTAKVLSLPTVIGPGSILASVSLNHMSAKS